MAHISILQASCVFSAAIFFPCPLIKIHDLKSPLFFLPQNTTAQTYRKFKKRITVLQICRKYFDGIPDNLHTSYDSFSRLNDLSLVFFFSTTMSLFFGLITKKNNDYEQTQAYHVFKNNDYEQTLATRLKNNNDYESTQAIFFFKRQ